MQIILICINILFEFDIIKKLKNYLTGHFLENFVKFQRLYFKKPEVKIVILNRFQLFKGNKCIFGGYGSVMHCVVR